MHAAEVPEYSEPDPGANETETETEPNPLAWLEDASDQLRALVRAHPTAALAGSVLLGVALARGVRAWRSAKA